MSRLVLVAVLVAFALPAHAAEECTDERAEALSDELFTYVEEYPEKGANLEIYIEQVEAEFGGEPTPEQTCDAIEMLMTKVKAEG